MKRKRKRADRRTGGFLPELARPEKRNVVTSDNKPWTAAEEAVAVAAICACDNRAEYSLMTPHLLDAVNHPASYNAEQNPSARVHLDNCIRALELKVITKMLGGYKGWEPTVPMGFTFSFRDKDAPLTWGEKAKIIRPWRRRRVEKKDHIHYECLLQMLGRREELPVAIYLNKLANDPNYEDREAVSVYPPVAKDAVYTLQAYVMELNNANGHADMIPDMKKYKRERLSRIYSILWSK